MKKKKTSVSQSIRLSNWSTVISANDGSWGLCSDKRGPAAVLSREVIAGASVKKRPL